MRHSVVFFLQFLLVKAPFSCLYIVGSMYFRIYFKHFEFIESFDLDSNSNNLFEKSSTSNFLVDLLKKRSIS